MPRTLHTDRRTLLRGAAAGAVATTVVPATSVSPAGAAPGKPPASRPNVVVISIDDLGWDELGCYGNTFNETPHIDALAAAGVRFTQAYAAAPLCSPTRAALVTGLYPARTGITDFLRGQDAVSDSFLPTSIPTVPDHLGPLGYTTGLIGKWHLTETYSGPYAERPGNPYAHGFDDVRVSEERYIADGDYFHPYFFMPSVSALEPGEHLTDRLAREAESFVADHADEPFFLHLSNYAVHTVLDGKPAQVAKYRAKPGAGQPGQRPQLAAMLESVDDQVGAVVAALRRHGIAERTLVVVVSDNGGPDRPTNLPLRGGKGELYEAGIRVPTVAAWAAPRAGAPTGRVDDTPVSTVDLLPTAIELAGGKQPHGRHRLDGISLAPLVSGDRGRLERRDTLFWVYPHHIGQTHPQAAVRSGDLKMVKQLRDGSVELFDLAADEAETTDLVAARPRDARRLERLLDDHLREVDVLPPAPSERAYPVPDAAVDWSTVDVLTVPGGGAAAATEVVGDRLRVTSGPLSHVVLRSGTAPSSGEVAAVLDLGGFSGSGTQETAFVGLAVDGGTYLLMRYRHDLRRVGWDLRVDGTLRDAGAEPLASLDGSVDLSGPGSRLAFVLRGAKATAYADQGRGAGWEFLFTVDTRGFLDLSDPAVRARTRYAASARVAGTSLTLGPLTASRAR